MLGYALSAISQLLRGWRQSAESAERAERRAGGAVSRWP